MPRIHHRRAAAVGLLVLAVGFIPASLAQSAADAASAGAAAQTIPSLDGAAIQRIGGPVSAPELTSKVEPEFSEQARAQKFSGVVTVSLIVDTKGRPQNVHVIRGVGSGLDEQALVAVRQYRFKPAMLNGRPVPVHVNVEINFRFVDKLQSN